MDITAALLAVLTLVAGVAIGWFAARARAAAAVAAAVNTAVGAVSAERDALRSEHGDLRTERDVARSERDAARADGNSLRAERDRLLDEVRQLDVRAAESASQVATLEQAQEQLKDTFARLSDEALARSNSRFLELADSRLQRVGQPLTETLGRVETQLREIEVQRVSAHQLLSSQIDLVKQTGEDLRRETGALVDALRKPQARGRWGELQLRRCVEIAGMADRCDFDEQVSVSTADGPLRPDMVVRLAGGKSVVVDSKVTLAAYLEAHEAQQADVREARLAAHAKHLRQHVEQLAAKSYWSQVSPAPEFVILFVPGEAFLAPALERDPQLLDDAISKRVHIATPTTLVSMLRTIAYAWQQEALAENAREVFDLGRELYKRLGTMGGHLDRLGRALTGSVKTYNDTVGSMERQVLVTARKLNTLQVVDTEIELCGGVEEPVRPLAAPELVVSAESARPVVALPSRGGADEPIDDSYGVDPPAGEQLFPARNA